MSSVFVDNLVFILTVLIVLIVLTPIKISAKEFCAHEYFNPECREGEVIVMERAEYGRMKAGKCVQIHIDTAKNDQQYFGCKADVLDIMDAKCSGLQKCNVLVMDQELMKRSTCYSDLVHYLDADYFCQQVFKVDPACRITLNEHVIYMLIGGKLDGKKIENCGGATNPLIVEASAGQNVKVSIRIFYVMTASITFKNKSNQTNNKFCKDNAKSDSHLGTIKDSSDISSKNYICSYDNRDVQVVVSNTNRLSIEANDNVEARYILLLEATGCHDLKPPQDGWMKREDRYITIGCYMNRHTWKLVCNDRNWVGVIGNCTQRSGDIKERVEISTETKLTPKTTESVFILLVGTCLVILIIFGITCVLLIYFQSKPKNIEFKKDILHDGGTNLSRYGDMQLRLDKVTNDKLDVSYQDPSYFILENDKEILETTTNAISA